MAVYPTITGLWDRLSAVTGAGTLEADTSAAEVGDDVDCWLGINNGSTGFITGPQAESTERPTLVASAPNGANVVEFDSTDHLIDASSQFSLAYGSGRTITIAWKWSPGQSEDLSPVYEMNLNNTFIRGEGVLNDFATYEGSGSLIHHSTFEPNSNAGWHVHTVASAAGATGNEVWLDGVKDTGSNEADGVDALNRLSFGQHINTAAQTTGIHILGMCIYNVKLSDANIALVQQYYNAQGGLDIAALNVTPAPGLNPGMGIGTFPQDD